VWTAFAVAASDAASKSSRLSATRAADRRRELPLQDPPPVEGLGTSIDVRL
jgi:hypothetical protein